MNKLNAPDGPTMGINIFSFDLASADDGRPQARRPIGLCADAQIGDDGPNKRIMKTLIAALALATLIAAPTFAHPANAAPMSPASSSFGSNGY